MSGRAGDDGAVSSSSDDRSRCERAASSSQPPRASKNGADAGGPSAQREQHLTELLARASGAIRSERDKVARLEAENARLVAQLGIAGVTPAAHGGASNGTAPQGLLRQRVQDLALENFVAVQTIRTLRQRVETLENQLATEVVVSPIKTPTPRKGGNHRRASSAQPIPGVRRALVTIASPPHSPPQSRNSRPSPGKQPQSPPDHPHPIKQTFPPQHHHFDAMRSVKQLQDTAAAANNGDVDGTEVKSYNDVMIHRLRRALAPPPTKEQLGEVVHAMVCEMVKHLRRRGSNLVAKKLDHGTYLINEKRKVHMTVDSGRLVVKCGGGHVDLLEFLERNKLCNKAGGE